jgi:hypothetical protein
MTTIVYDNATRLIIIQLAGVIKYYVAMIRAPLYAHTCGRKMLMNSELR